MDKRLYLFSFITLLTSALAISCNEETDITDKPVDGTQSIALIPTEITAEEEAILGSCIPAVNKDTVFLVNSETDLKKLSGKEDVKALDFEEFSYLLGAVFFSQLGNAIQSDTLIDKGSSYEYTIWYRESEYAPQSPDTRIFCKKYRKLADKPVIFKVNLWNESIPGEIKVQRVLPARSFETDLLKDEECVVIRTKNELLKYFSDSYIASNEFLNAIDFNKSSLIIGKKKTNNGLVGYEAALEKQDTKNYIYNVIIETNCAEVLDICFHGIIADRVPNEIKIDFNVMLKQEQNKGGIQQILPVNIFFTDKLGINECTVIRSKEELLQYFTPEYIGANNYFNTIDFSKSSLILGIKGLPNGFVDFNATLEKTGDSYLYNMFFKINDTCEAPLCYHASITDKIDNNATVISRAYLQTGNMQLTLPFCFGKWPQENGRIIPECMTYTTFPDFSNEYFCYLLFNNKQWYVPTDVSVYIPQEYRDGQIYQAQIQGYGLMDEESIMPSQAVPGENERYLFHIQSLKIFKPQ